MNGEEVHICEVCLSPSIEHSQSCPCGCATFLSPLCCPGCPCGSYEEAHEPTQRSDVTPGRLPDSRGNNED